ncbi:MAG: RES domain-containing protein [Betaproteobacteria bacterium]|nr:RES domain-containing protein [Betaproteobacteria bacterium]
MIVYRICKARYAKTAFSGAGGREASGRWHYKGQPILYAAATLSLAALEYLVHLGRRDAKVALVSVEAAIPEAVVVEVVEVASLPKNWNSSPPIEATMALGTRWCVGLRSAVLKVPSAIVPGEFNFLLNPQHPDFKRIKLSKPEPFSFDPRLLK